MSVILRLLKVCPYHLRELSLDYVSDAVLQLHRSIDKDLDEGHTVNMKLIPLLLAKTDHIWFFVGGKNRKILVVILVSAAWFGNFRDILRKKTGPGTKTGIGFEKDTGILRQLCGRFNYLREKDG